MTVALLQRTLRSEATHADRSFSFRSSASVSQPAAGNERTSNRVQGRSTDIGARPSTLGLRGRSRADRRDRNGSHGCITFFRWRIGISNPVIWRITVHSTEKITGSNTSLISSIYAVSAHWRLGPLEGHHSVLLEKMGVRENIAIEARTENMRKCARIKEKYGLVNTTFLQQNIEDLIAASSSHCIQVNSISLFALGSCTTCPIRSRRLNGSVLNRISLFLGTHYVEKDDPWRYPPEWFEEGVYEYRGKTLSHHAVSRGRRSGPAEWNVSHLGLAL